MCGEGYMRIKVSTPGLIVKTIYCLWPDLIVFIALNIIQMLLKTALLALLAFLITHLLWFVFSEVCKA